jgi:hypothetical protein
MEGLLRKRPEFFCEACGGVYHPFETLDEIALAEERIERIIMLGRLVQDALESRRRGLTRFL